MTTENFTSAGVEAKGLSPSLSHCDRKAYWTSLRPADNYAAANSHTKEGNDLCQAANVRKAPALSFPVVHNPIIPNKYLLVLDQPLVWNFCRASRRHGARILISSFLLLRLGLRNNLTV